MAQTNRGKQTSTSTKRTTSKNAGSNKASQRTPQKTPRRREIMAAVCFILAAFTFIAYFTSDGAFIRVFTGLARGLIGGGFFYLAPVLLMCAITLAFHRGRPVIFRIVCALMLSVLAGALTHLFSRPSGYEFELSFAQIPILWTSGLALESGGVISGFIADLSGWLFGRTGATIVLLIATGFFLLSCINKSIISIINAIKNRPKIEYEQKPEPEPMAAAVVDTISRQVSKRVNTAKNKKAIDIPIDDESATAKPPESKEKKESLFKSSPGVRTPDQLISEYTKEASEPIEPVQVEETKPEKPDLFVSSEDLPLDIPFMEGQRKRESQLTSPDIESIDVALDSSSAQSIFEPSSEQAPKQTPELTQKLVPEPNPTPEPTVPIPVSTIKEPTEAVDIEYNTPAPVSSQVLNAQGDFDAQYIFPPLDLLAKGTAVNNDYSDEVTANSQRLEAAFKSFGVNVTISNATRGPAVTRYEASLEPGVKLSKITNLADDIALSLGTSGVRIAAMPNMASTVGIEVPNKSISVVYLRDIIESKEFKDAKSKLTFAIGKNISGDSIAGNVSKMPHMMVAGTTGSGKSVCLNSIILSILYKASPSEVKFIMIDPKMVEFKVYNEIPHLQVPVVTDVQKASGALQYAVVAMTKRYSAFSDSNARDLDSYNEIARENDLEVYPRLVVIIDELADLMMTAAKEVEESICRIAQMGRAAGIHLIIATQSPRADVITGLMKANIPSRIAFKVSSALESRIILDVGGNADKLVGNGDMLFAPIGVDKPVRVQGTWVSDAEREAVVGFIKNSSNPQYSEEVMDEINKLSEKKGAGEKAREESDPSDYDELLPQAADWVFETGQGSVSIIQRKLKVGFARAGRIVDQLEEIGFLGPHNGSKPRDILLTRDQWRQMQYTTGTAPMDLPKIPDIYSVSEESAPEDEEKSEDTIDS